MPTLKSVKKYGAGSASIVKITIEMTVLDTSGDAIRQCDLNDATDSIHSELGTFVDDNLDSYTLVSAVVTATAEIADRKK